MSSLNYDPTYATWSNWVAVVFQGADGTFAYSDSVPRPTPGMPYLADIAAADFNEDGRPDVAYANGLLGTPETFWLLLNACTHRADLAVQIAPPPDPPAIGRDPPWRPLAPPSV